jgi:hypothetical protein
VSLDRELSQLREIVGAVDLPFDGKSLDVEGDGTLILRGILATCGVDRQMEQFDEPSLRAKFKEYFERHPVVVDEHRLSKVIGRLTDYNFTNRGEIEVTAEIPRPPEGEFMPTYQRIKSGVMSAFSIGGRWKKLPAANGVKRVYPIEILEASVAGLPVNPDTLFEVVGTKSLGSGLDTELERLASLSADTLDRDLAALRGLV